LEPAPNTILKGNSGMDNAICRMTGVEFPLFAFSHCRDVVVAVSRAGGFGVLGCSNFTADQLEMELAWIDAHVDGKPYGVDVLFPETQKAQPGMTLEDFVRQIPEGHIDFVVELMEKHGVPMGRDEVVRQRIPPTAPDSAEALLDVAFRHPIRLVANALGIAPPIMIERGHAAGVPVAALVGAKEHAVRQATAGVDILVAQGGEAGGHCGEISTMVLAPEVIQAVALHGAPPVLAAGGIMTGRQMAGAMAMGAQGVWTGSVWLATSEAETSPVFRDKMVEARSSDTIRAKTRTGKPCRQLRSAWHDAWERPDAPAPLPLPLMPMLSSPALMKAEKAAEAGSRSARDLVTYFVGQGVGLVDAVRSATDVVQDFKTDFADAYEAFTRTVEGA
jgi:NAD(P)H-dependent flavin oxidoreductase YrpB (nitropropane dioxygenase family)